MTTAGRPPRLLVKTLTVTFVTVALLLAGVFAVVSLNMRAQVRRTITQNLEGGQRVFAAFESRRQRELMGLAATLAESPTLKAAVETYAHETRTGGQQAGDYLLTTIQRELEKIAARIASDAVIVVDADQTTLAAAGPLADRWPPGGRLPLIPADGGEATHNGVVEAGGDAFRVVAVPLVFANTLIGSLNLATVLDESYARLMEELSGAQVVVLGHGRAIASTLTSAATAAFQGQAPTAGPEGIVALDGERYAFRRLVQLDGTRFFALDSIDASTREPMAETARSLAAIAVGAVLLAFVGSFWLAQQLSQPIGRLSSELAAMSDAPGLRGQLALTGSSFEVDTLTEKFNALFASVAKAEARTEAAYTGAIRALATALDARDPYTAGHSERVAVLSVAIGRQLDLSTDDVEVLRLGALLHDIGKIGVPDAVLRKDGPLTDDEYAAIKEHPGLGARILRPVPFLARHIPIVELHHERPDGRGYPHGLQGDEIPLSARIVHVADGYDAMTSARAYRNAMPPPAAMHELWRCSGTEYNAEIVGALAAVLSDSTVAGHAPALERIAG